VAFPVQAGQLPAESPEPKSIPGSTKKYTPAQIDDLLNPPDWFPDEHKPAPGIVQKGHGDALACGSCHLMAGVGHPESADLTGFTADYIVQQMTDFKSGVRKDYARMNGISKALSDDEIRQAADWFAGAAAQEVDSRRRSGDGAEDVRRAGAACASSIRRRAAWSRSATASSSCPKIRRGRGCAIRSQGSSRTCRLEASRREVARDNGAGGRSVACSICHGDGLKGLANVPRIAGLHPIYIVRQLHLFKEGDRKGPDSALMTRPAAKLTDADILNIAAYVSSLSPE
jgi:cytochrome c553